MTRALCLATLLLAGCGAAPDPVASPVAAASTAVAARTVTTVEGLTPAVEEGPFFVDEMLNRADVRSNASPAGVPLTLNLRVLRKTEAGLVPFTGAQVDVWHADVDGLYSDEPAGQGQLASTLGLNWLRGYQLVDSQGGVTFRTYYPGYCQGRTAHLHVKVRQFSATGQRLFDFTTQLFFDDTVTDRVYADYPYSARQERGTRNNSDGHYLTMGSDGQSVGSHLLLDLTAGPEGGYQGTYTLVVIL